MSDIKRTITPNEPADFTPTREPQIPLRPFRYWCQKVLPLVYDDSLSYYELLCKVVDYLNKTMEDVTNMSGDIDNLLNAYKQLQEYVNNYFSTLDVQKEINNKLDDMAESGALQGFFANYGIGAGCTKNIGMNLPFYQWTNADTLTERMTKIMAVSGGKCCFTVQLSWDNDNKVFTIQNENLMDTAVALAKNFTDNGNTIKYLRIMGATNALSSGTTAQTVFNAYENIVSQIIPKITFEYTALLVFNEWNTSYYTDMISSLANIKEISMKPCGIDFTSYRFTDCNVALFDACDYIGVHMYPTQQGSGDYFTVKNATDRFNAQVNTMLVRLAYLKSINKYADLTEIGCSSSWNGFKNPESYYNDGIASPMITYIMGFMQSRIPQLFNEIYYWYVYDLAFYAETFIKALNIQKGACLNG